MNVRLSWIVQKLHLIACHQQMELLIHWSVLVVHSRCSGVSLRSYRLFSPDIKSILGSQASDSFLAECRDNLELLGIRYDHELVSRVVHFQSKTHTSWAATVTDTSELILKYIYMLLPPAGCSDQPPDHASEPMDALSRGNNPPCSNRCAESSKNPFVPCFHDLWLCFDLFRCAFLHSLIMIYESPRIFLFRFCCGVWGSRRCGSAAVWRTPLDQSLRVTVSLKICYFQKFPPLNFLKTEKIKSACLK